MPLARLNPAAIAAALLACLLTAAPATAQADRTKSTRPDRVATQEEKDAAAAVGAGLFGGSLLCMGIVILGSALVYFAPSAIGVFRGHPNLAPILVVNIFLGWSLIGWVVAMAWALTAQEPRSRGRAVSRHDDNPFG